MPRKPSPSIAERATFTLPIHETCHHRHYLLTCEQFEDLIAEANNSCQVCGLPGAENSLGKLFIDHVGACNWAVRGLLCNRCNTIIGKDNEIPRNDAFARYLANAWYLRQLAKRGISAEGPLEPPDGGRVRDGHGRTWHREGSYWTTRDGRMSSRSWRDLVRSVGPFALTVLWTDHLTLSLANPHVMAEELKAHMRPELLAELRDLLCDHTRGEAPLMPPHFLARRRQAQSRPSHQQVSTEGSSRT